MKHIFLIFPLLTLGGVADHVFGNDVTIKGDLSVSGSATKHAEITVNENANATTINTVNVWEEVNDDLAAGSLDGFTVATSDITVSAGSAGQYEVLWSASSTAASANKTYEVSVSVDNTIESKCNFARRYSSNDVGNSGGHCIITLADGEVVKLEVRNTTDSTNITFRDATLLLIAL